jgi:hypothetical protein
MDGHRGIRWDCRPCLPLTRASDSAGGVGQGSVILHTTRAEYPYYDPFGENSPLSEANLLV